MRIRLLIGFLVAMACAFPAALLHAEKVDIFRIGTGGVRGTYYPVGQSIAIAISNPKRETNCVPAPCGVPGLLAIPQSSNGSVSNIEDIHNKKIESAFSQSDVAYWARMGGGVFEDGGRLDDVAAIASLYMENIHLVARKGAGIHSVYDLVGKRVSLDDPGSGTLVDTRIILKAYGIAEKNMKVQYVKPAAAMKKMRAGSLDAFFTVAGSPSKAISELANEGLITLIELDGPVVDRIIHENSFFSKQVIPAGCYKGIGDTPTLGVAALWVVNKNQSVDRIYKITKTFWESLPKMRTPGSHPKLALISLQHAFDSASVPMHPGAMKYYNEIGLKDPREGKN